MQGLSEADLDLWVENLKAADPEQVNAMLQESAEYWECHERAMGREGGPAARQWRELQRRLRFRRLRTHQARPHVTLAPRPVARPTGAAREHRAGSSKPSRGGAAARPW